MGKNRGKKTGNPQGTPVYKTQPPKGSQKGKRGKGHISPFTPFKRGHPGWNQRGGKGQHIGASKASRLIPKGGKRGKKKTLKDQYLTEINKKIRKVLASAGKETNGSKTQDNLSSYWKNWAKFMPSQKCVKKFKRIRYRKEVPPIEVRN